MRSISGIKKAPNRGIVLLSGGIDSTVALYIAKKYGYELYALIFDYGQRHKKEIHSARKIAHLNRISYHVVEIRLPWSASSLTQKDVRIPTQRNISSKEVPSTYVSGRNLIFLSFALSCAESLRAKNIFIGAHTQDYSRYPDCRPEFLSSFEHTARYAVQDKGIKIIAPLGDKSKKETIEIGLKLGVPFHLTWSCYKGGAKPCGQCDSCRFRIRAFAQLNMVDPLLAKAKGYQHKPQSPRPKFKPNAHRTRKDYQ